MSLNTLAHDYLAVANYIEICHCGDTQDVKANVDQLLAHMEVAAEKDMEANKQGQPAVMKLKMLPQVSLFVCTYLSPFVQRHFNTCVYQPFFLVTLQWPCLSALKRLVCDEGGREAGKARLA